MKLTAVVTTDGPFKGQTFDLEAPESQPEWGKGDELYFVEINGSIFCRPFGEVDKYFDLGLIASGNAFHTEAEAIHFRDHDPRSYAWNCAFTTVRNFIRERFGLDGEWKKGEWNYTAMWVHVNEEMEPERWRTDQHNNYWHVRTEEQARAVLDELAAECKLLCVSN